MCNKESAEMVMYQQDEIKNCSKLHSSHVVTVIIGNVGGTEI